LYLFYPTFCGCVYSRERPLRGYRGLYRSEQDQLRWWQLPHLATTCFVSSRVALDSVFSPPLQSNSSH